MHAHHDWDLHDNPDELATHLRSDHQASPEGHGTNMRWHAHQHGYTLVDRETGKLVSGDKSSALR